MTPLRCDGCWREEPHSPLWISVRCRNRWRVRVLLCPACAERFEAFLKSLREEPL